MSGLSRSDAQKRNADLLRLLILGRVRAELSGRLYCSPLKYTNRALDPHVDRQVSSFLAQLSRGQLADPRRLQRAVHRYLSSFPARTEERA